MSDPKKSRQQLLEEIAELRARLGQLEDAEAKRKRSEEALRQSERDKSLILGSLSELISYQDKSLRVVWANKAAGDSVGRSPEELVGRYCYEIWHGRQEPCLVCPVQKSFKTHKPEQGEVTSPDGRVWYISGCPVLNEQGEVAGAVEVTLDVTHRKQAEESLRSERNKLEALFEGLARAKIGIDVVGTDYRVRFQNQVLIKRFGNLIGQLCYEKYMGRKQPCNFCPMIQAIKSNKLQSVELTPIDGRNYELLSAPLPNPDGTVDKAIEVFRDITERRKAAEALQYRMNFEKLITSISTDFINLSAKEVDDGINQALKALGEFADVDRSYVFQFSDDGRKTSNTHEWCADGITPQIHNLQDLSVDSTPWWMGKLRKFETIHIPDVEKLPRRAKNEKEILQAQSIKSLIAIPMVYNRRLVGFMGFDSVRRKRTWSQEIITLLTIVSEIFVNTLMRKRTQQELDEYHEKMFRAEQLASLGTLSATIAHELNQPLTVMQLFLQQGLRDIKKGRDIDKVAEKLKDSLEEVSKAAVIVDRFRKFARKSSPRRDISEVNPVEIANRITGVLAEGAIRAKLNLSVDVKNHPPHILGNVVEFEQIFFVLIQNAIHAADGKTWRDLKITISSQDSQLQLTFADTCGGIDPEHIDRIFEPFFTTKPADIGTGLGLCILERIVKRYNGSVRVENKPGHGTIFYICLLIRD